MPEESRAFDRHLRRVRRRLVANLLLRQLGVSLCLAVVPAAGAVALLKLGLLAGAWWQAWPVLPAAVLAGLGLAWARRPGAMTAALAIDRELNTRERFSSALALRGDASTFARAAVADARRAAGRIDLRRRFAIRPTAHGPVALALLGGLVAAGLGLPTVDLLGLLARREEHLQQQSRLAEARSDVDQAVASVQTAVRKLGDPDLTEALEALEASGELTRPQDVRRDAIRKLGNLKDQLQQRRENQPLASFEEMQSSLRNLRSLPDPASRDLHRAVAEGDFNKAAETLDELRQKLQDGKLSEQQRDALQRQLADLGEQLDRLAKQNAAAKRACQQAGLDEEHAGMGEEELREELKKRGWTEEQIDELARRLRDCHGGSQQLAELAEQVAATCQGENLSPADLADLARALRRSGTLQDQIAQIEGNLEDVENALRLLGGQGDGGGLALTPQPGGSKAGSGPGSKQASDPIDAKMLDTRVQGKPAQGPAVASWYFRGRQVRGKARQQLQQVVRAARDRAGDAISEQTIPRRYETPVKRYFGDFEELSEDRP